DSSTRDLLNSNSVTVVFNQPVEPVSASDASHYSIDHGVTVTGASVQSGGESVVLSTSSINPGPIYALTVNGVSNLADEVIAPNTEICINLTPPRPAVANVLVVEAEHSDHNEFPV